jgi:hypothetical protein
MQTFGGCLTPPRDHAAPFTRRG